MTNLVEAPGWDGVPQLELNTQALGGPGGPMNLQAQALLNRLAWLRQRASLALLATTTIHVAPAPAGNDANDGLTVGTPLLTMQRAWELMGTMNRNGKAFKLKLADGTYDQNLTCAGTPPGAANVGANGYWNPVLVEGNLATPASVLVRPPAGVTSAAFAVSNCFVQVSGVRVDSSLAKAGAGCAQFLATTGGQIDLGNIDYGPAGGGPHINALEGGYIFDYSNSTISGSARTHYEGWLNGYIEGGWTTKTITGTPAFSSAFASSWTGALLWISGQTFVGGATGKRFEIGQGGQIHQSAYDYFPGNAAGSFSCGKYGESLNQIAAPVAFASLPAASAALKGVRSFVTDSTTSTWGATVTGGGANNVPVWCDGTDWRVG